MAEQHKETFHARETQSALLLEEYRQCCEDRRQRDRYIQTKFVYSALTLVLLGGGGITSLQYVQANPSLLAVPIAGALYAFIMLASLIKDAHLRQGTEVLLQHLSDRLWGPPGWFAFLVLNLQPIDCPPLWSRRAGRHQPSRMQLGTRFRTLLPRIPPVAEPDAVSLIWPRLAQIWLSRQHATSLIAVFYLLVLLGFLAALGFGIHRLTCAVSAQAVGLHVL